MHLPQAGELAALGTASCWAVSALAFESAVRRAGSLTVNLLRLILALFLLAAVETVARGLPLPVDAGAHAWLWLSVSGLAGFAFGDFCLFRAYAMIGPRLASLVMSLAPLLTAVIGWLLLDERLTPRDVAGMALTVGGVAWAVGERRRSSSGPGRPVAGTLLALGGALGQAVGLVLSKLGMGDYDPFAATQIRVVAGIAGYVLLITVLGRWRRIPGALADRSALRATAIGGFFGPFLGVSLSLVAIQRTLTGVAASIMATTPILLIPAVVLLKRERVGPGGVLGALLAVGGVVLLFL